MANQSCGNKPTARDRLFDKLDKIRKNQGIYNYSLNEDGTITLTPVKPIKSIKIDRDFEYNKNVKFDDIIKAMI